MVYVVKNFQRNPRPQALGHTSLGMPLSRTWNMDLFLRQRRTTQKIG